MFRLFRVTLRESSSNSAHPHPTMRTHSQGPTISTDKACLPLSAHAFACTSHPGPLGNLFSSHAFPWPTHPAATTARRHRSRSTAWNEPASMLHSTPSSDAPRGRDCEVPLFGCKGVLRSSTAPLASSGGAFSIVGGRLLLPRVVGPGPALLLALAAGALHAHIFLLASTRVVPT